MAAELGMSRGLCLRLHGAMSRPAGGLVAAAELVPLHEGCHLAVGSAVVVESGAAGRTVAVDHLAVAEDVHPAGSPLVVVGAVRAAAFPPVVAAGAAVAAAARLLRQLSGFPQARRGSSAPAGHFLRPVKKFT
jgi:hypothetical protein